MTKPKIELRKVSHNKSLSQETAAYTAQVWVDGKHFCDVSNHGHGGCDMQDPPRGVDAATFYPALKALNVIIGETFPEINCTTFGGKGTMKRNLESICGELLDEHLVSSDLRRLLKRTVAYYDPAKKAVLSFKGKHEGVARAHLVTETIRKNPSAKVLNNLPFDEALALYRSA